MLVRCFFTVTGETNRLEAISWLATAASEGSGFRVRDSSGAGKRGDREKRRGGKRGIGRWRDEREGKKVSRWEGGRQCRIRNGECKRRNYTISDCRFKASSSTFQTVLYVLRSLPFALRRVSCALCPLPHTHVRYNASCAFTISTKLHYPST